MTELNEASDHILPLKYHNHELLQDPASIHYLPATITRNAYDWFGALSNSSKDISLTMTAHSHAR